MRQVARVGDTVTGVCQAHSDDRPFTGTITQGSGVLSNNSIAIARIGDVGITDCGHHFHIVEGSTIFTVDGGIGIARVGDAVVVDEGGYGTIVTGSDSFYTP